MAGMGAREEGGKGQGEGVKRAQKWRASESSEPSEPRESQTPNQGATECEEQLKANNAGIQYATPSAFYVFCIFVQSSKDSNVR